MKRLFTFLSLLVIVVMVAGCAQAPAEQAPATGGEELYIFLPKGLDNPYWDECRKGMEAKAAELGVKAEFLGPETSDAAKQVAIFETVIARKPAGISVSPNDPETVKAAVAAAMAAGIPVIAWDADVPGSERIAYVGTNNFEAGKVAGEELAKVIGGQGKVAILHGALTAANAIERVDGFLEALKNYPGIEVVAIEPTEDNHRSHLQKLRHCCKPTPTWLPFMV
jgi:ABC-type sugar transport system substrate-binding protein